MKNDKLLNYLHLHFIVFIWGFTAVLGALISLDAVPLVWYRMGLAVIMVFVYLLIRKEKLKLPWKTVLKFAGGGIIIAAHWLTFFMAIKVSNVSITLAVLSTGAFFASILEPIFYKRKIIYYEVLFGLCVMIGLYVIFEVDTSYALGIALALTSAFLSALFSVINGKFILHHKATVISFYELLTGVLAISVYLFFTDAINADFFKLSMSDWLYLFILASICTAYAFIASIYVMRWISPYTVMLTINLEPVYGILLALLILGDSEVMDIEFYYGALIILATVIGNGIIKMRLKRKRT
ncbi:MAG: DMT family transporter [Bacteroidetes bacterium]|jgi:drug/metabolite transporter (DMT)-like permease|nr:DMT family transporter [Bacteroidota bacterium]